MNKPWKIEFWGTRGSVPVADSRFLEYGGNTSCVSLEWDEGLLIFDGGSGLIQLGRALSDRNVNKRLDILLSHFHMDHIQGLPGFQQFYDPDTEIHLYGEGGDGISFAGRLETVIGRPYWPVGFQDFKADVFFHEIRAGESFSIRDGIRVSTLRGRHPGGTILYRADMPGRSAVYGLDCELDRDMLDRLAEFAGGAGLIICDGNFTEEDMKRYQGWGHSSWKQGIALRRAAGALKAAVTHFSWEYTDKFLREQEKLAIAEDPASCFAKERMELWL